MASNLQPSRRNFIQKSLATTAVLSTPLQLIGKEAKQANCFQATGLRIGEVTTDSAIVWTRLTKNTTRNNDGIVFTKRGDDPKARKTPVDQIEGACPGKAGRMRVVYSLSEDFSNAQTTEWAGAIEENDFTHHFSLTGLQPNHTYFLACETESPGEPAHGPLLGTFRTAPTTKQIQPVHFCVMTCQGYPDRDHKDGHPIYPSMSALDPDFISLTGDLLYYDNDAPSAMTVDLARLHWQRMFSLPRLVETLRNTCTYWLKDDHDTLKDDSWPGQKYGELTFEKGQEIFRQQAPMGEDSYRTFRWGPDLQIWLAEGRDDRTPNKQPDGPDKKIWGDEQIAWFKKTVAESDATWKLLISPTPFVGPDRKRKNDNHSNATYTHEGDHLKSWIQENVPERFFVVCGDRHWQYHSIDPKTAIQEFSVGAASNSHAGGTPGYNPEIHQFHKVQGGFLSVDVEREQSTSKIVFRLRDVDGNVSYEKTYNTTLS